MKRCILVCSIFLYSLILLQSGCDYIDLYDFARGWSEQVLELTPGNDGKLSILTLTTYAVSLSWSRARDETVAQENLQYGVVYSTSDNISTTADAWANGTFAGGGWLTDITSDTITGLAADTVYYITVLVWDGTVTTPAEDAYRKYNTISFTTYPEILYMYAAPAHDGNFTTSIGTARDDLNYYCAASMPAGHNFNNVYAVVTIDSGDMLSALSVPSLYWQVRNASTQTEVAPIWFNFISNNLTNNLNTTLGVTGSFWTGNGTNIGANTCNGWTDNSNTVSGYTGTGNSTIWSNDNTATCNSTLPVLCVGWY